MLHSSAYSHPTIQNTGVNITVFCSLVSVEFVKSVLKVASRSFEESVLLTESGLQ